MAQTKMDRTMAGLRDALLDEWDALRAGKGDVQRASAVATLARQVLASVKIEVHFAKQTASLKPGDKLPQIGAPLALGRPRR
jgi:hypothetical protein